MTSLTGRAALVTGGATGIGRAVAIALAANGTRVVINYRRSEGEANDVVARIGEMGGTAIAVRADVSNPSEAKSLVKEAEARFGPIGILVNNAGISSRRSLDEVGERDWDEALRTNLSSAFYVTQAALPGMRAERWGRIIMMSSIAAQRGGLIGPHYAASKAGMIGLAHSYAAMLAREGITANAITPALIETAMVRDNPAASPELIPVGRYGTTDEVASLVVELATNGYVTGQTIGVNGGWHMT
jgi:3-oxoacyl-[acyl-carrier protein] reductase